MEATFSLEQIDDVAAQLLTSGKRIFTFTGELGAGKTTLIKALGRQLGVEHDMSSPSFGIVNEYQTQYGAAYHFDLYRTKDVSELLEIGFDEYLESGSFCFIEWPEVAADVLEHYNSVRVDLTVSEDDSRHIRTSI